MRRHFLLLLKGAVSVLLLYFSLRSVHLEFVMARLARPNPFWIALALALTTSQVLLIAIRWRIIAAVCAFRLNFSPMLQMSFIAMFFNQVLPSTIGGDAVRIWLLARKGCGWANSTYSVLIDRIAGLFFLALVVIACLPWTFALITDPMARVVLIVIGGGAVGGAGVFLAVGILPSRLFDRFMVTRHLAETAHAALRLVCSPRAWISVGLCSLAIQVITVAAAWCCMKAVGSSIGFAPILFLLPPVILIASVPISIAGWGVRESSMVVAFAYAGLSQQDGLMLSILFGASSFAVGAVGGLVWVASGLRTMSPAVAEMPDPELVRATAE